MYAPIENGDRVKMHERLATLETQMNTILTNHLPHLAEDIKGLKSTLNWGIMLLVTNVIALLYAIVEDTIVHK